MAIEEASSSSIWMNVPPTLGTRAAKRSTTTVEGVMGYPAAKRAPAASAPSQQAWSPSRKWTPVRTPAGSAFMSGLLRLGLLAGFVAEDGEVRAVHAAQIASRTLLRVDHVRRVIALGIKRRRKRQHLGGTELDAEAAGLAAFHHNLDRAFCHESSFALRRTRGGLAGGANSGAKMNWEGLAGSDHAR